MRIAQIFVKILNQTTWNNRGIATDNCAMKIGQIIRKIRKEKKLTLEELAFQVGTDAANLSRIECGKQNPSPDSLEKIAFSLQFPISSLYLLLEQNTESPLISRFGSISSNAEELKHARKRHDQFVTKFMLLDSRNQALVNDFLTAILKAYDK